MAENKEYYTQKAENGSIQISEDVVASVAAMAVMEQEGVCVEKCGPEYAEAQKERKCDNQCSYYEENKRRTCTTAIGLCSTTNFPLQRVLANGRIRCVSESECHEQSYYVQSNGERRCGYCAGVYRVDALSQFRVCIAESECAGVIRAG